MVMHRERKIGYNHLVTCIIALLLLTYIAFTSGCTAKGSQRSAYLTDERFPPKPPSAPIEIISGEPLKPYILVGEVSALADVPLLESPDTQTAIDKIKAMARNMGGDAIIRYSGYRAPAGTVNAGQFTAQGMVVRWK
jgi:hypothetical protein